ncbi:MAG: integrase arm-type DNA-binding domain-containing protein [Cognatishimia activa]
MSNRKDNKVKLTDSYLRRFKADPPLARLTKTDTDQRGLKVRINETGRISFSVEIRVAGGKKRYQTLGTFPTMSVAQARSAAARAYGEAREGKDPIREARIAARAATTLGDAIQQLHKDMTLRARKSADEQRREMEKHFARLLDHPINEDLAQQMRTLILNLAGEGKIAYSNHLRSWAGSTLRYAARELGTGTDWSIRLPKRFAERPRDALISPRMCKKIIEASQELKNPNERDYVQLCVLTAQRGAEIRTLSRAHLMHNQQCFKLNDEETKAGRAMVTPLGPMAWQIIQDAAARHEHERIVCTRTGGALGNIGRTWKNLKEILNWQNMEFRPHDLRRSFASHMLGVPLGIESKTEVIDRCIGHVPAGITQSGRVYLVDSDEQVEMRRTVFTAWENEVMAA